MKDFSELKATGLQVQYHQVCKRKLWLHSHQINFEQDSDTVLQGKILHEQSYNYKDRKELDIDQLIKIDLYEDEYIGEVKSSSKMTHADRAQLMYYLYVLKQLGIEKKGRIHYPKEKKTEEITLTKEDEKKIEEILMDIENVISQEKPPKFKKLPYCSKCAYHSFCFAGEE